MSPARVPIPISSLAALFASACSGGRAASLPIEPPSSFQREVLAVEAVAVAAQRDVRARLLEGLARGDPLLASEALAEGFAGRFPRPEDGEPVPDADLDLRSYARGAGPTLDARGLCEVLSAHVGGWTRFQRLELEADRFWLEPSGRGATARVELHLAGERADGVRAELRATCDARLVLDAAERWRLAALDLLEGTRIERAGATFVDVTDSVGLHYSASAENRAMLQTFVDSHQTLALGGLSAVDWNRDGFWDLIGTRRGQLSTLFLNDGAGGFVSAPLPVRSPRESPSFLLYVDLDGDGLEELVDSEVLSYAGDRARMGLYTRRDGEWVLVPDAFEFENPVGLRRLSVQTVVPTDVDGDGRLDLFFAVYGSALSRGEDYNTVEAHDGADNHLFINHGELHFSEESEARGIHGTQYTYVAQAFDFDADGDSDLFEGNDFGPNVLWENDGSGHFTADETLGFGGVSAYTMGVTLADWDNSGAWSLYISNMSSEAGGRVAGMARGISEDMRARIATIAGGNMLYTEGDGVAWREHAREAHCDEGGWAWGCVFFDLDDDGDKDLFVTNGFTSHSNPALGDWESHYWNQVAADGGFLERREKSRDVNRGHPFEGSFSGYERDRLFYNADGSSTRFYEAGFAFGLDHDHDGRCVVPVDVDGDGDLDLVLWTLRGLRLFENRASRGRFARVALEASRGDRHALGAVVRLTAGGVTQRDYVKLVDGFQSQVPSELHFGLGSAERVSSVVVEWPSGKTEEWRDLPVERRILLRQGDGEARIAPLAAWPASARPRRCVPTLAPTLERLDGGRETLAESGRATVVRVCGAELAPDAPWPGLAELTAAHPEARCVLVATGEFSEGRGHVALPAQVPALLGDGDFLAQTFGPEPLATPATFVFAPGGGLRRAFLREARAPELIAVLDALADEQPFPELLMQTGRLALRRGRYREAQRNFERALEVDSELPFALEGLARAHLRLGRPILAEKAYEGAVALDPDYALGHYNLAMTRVQLGRAAEAIAPLREALRVSGEERATLLALAEVALLADELEIALDAYRRAGRLDPSDAELATTVAKVLAKLQRYAQAREAFLRALELAPGSAEARAGLERVESLLAKEREG